MGRLGLAVDVAEVPANNACLGEALGEDWEVLVADSLSFFVCHVGEEDVVCLAEDEENKKLAKMIEEKAEEEEKTKGR